MSRPAEQDEWDKVEVTFERSLHTEKLLTAEVFLLRAGWPSDALTQSPLPYGLFCIDVNGMKAYPCFFADGRYDLTVLESVSRALGDLSPGSKLLFFTQPSGYLALPALPGQGNGVPRTPLQALVDGDVERVMRAAAGHARF